MVLKHLDYRNRHDGGVNHHGVINELCFLTVKIRCSITDDAIDFNPWVISRVYVNDSRL